MNLTTAFFRNGARHAKPIRNDNVAIYAHSIKIIIIILIPLSDALNVPLPPFHVKEMEVLHFPGNFLAFFPH